MSTILFWYWYLIINFDIELYHDDPQENNDPKLQF